MKRWSINSKKYKTADVETQLEDILHHIIIMVSIYSQLDWNQLDDAPVDTSCEVISRGV